MDFYKDLEARINKLKDGIIVNREGWQLEAIETINKLVDGSQYKGIIFRWYKYAPEIARIAINDTIELHKPFSRYFLKVCWAIRNKQKLQQKQEFSIQL